MKTEIKDDAGRTLAILEDDLDENKDGEKNNGR